MTPGIEIQGVNRLERFIYQVNLTTSKKPRQCRWRCLSLYKKDHLRFGKPKTDRLVFGAMPEKLYDTTTLFVPKIRR
jgi:hypothetical protein